MGTRYGFPYQQIRGSVQDRNKFVDNKNTEVYNTIVNRMGTYYCNFDSFEGYVKELSPEYKDVNVIARTTSENYLASLQTGYDSGSKKLNYTIEVPSAQNHFYLEDLPTFMHENTHFLDSMANPKRMRCHEKFLKNSLINPIYGQLYTNFYLTTWNDEASKKNAAKQLKYNLQTFLQDKPYKTKMLYLNHLRYGMETEAHAYTVSEKYETMYQQNKIKNFEELEKKDIEMAQQLNLKSRIEDMQRTLTNLKENFSNRAECFSRKKELVDKVMFNIIYNEHNNHKKMLSSKGGIVSFLKNIIKRML